MAAFWFRPDDQLHFRTAIKLNLNEIFGQQEPMSVNYSRKLLNKQKALELLTAERNNYYCSFTCNINSYCINLTDKKTPNHPIVTSKSGPCIPVTWMATQHFSMNDLASLVATSRGFHCKLAKFNLISSCLLFKCCPSPAPSCCQVALKEKTVLVVRVVGLYLSPKSDNRLFAAVFTWMWI